MTAPDYGAEDYTFPDLEGLDPNEAAKIWDAIEREAAEANRRAKRLKDRKARAKELTLQAIESSPYTSIRIPGAEGRDVQLTPYPWTVFTVIDEVAFREWAGKESERYYDDTPRLREDVFRSEMRRREQDRESLPPGVTSWTDTKISRTAVAQRKKKRTP